MGLRPRPRFRAGRSRAVGRFGGLVLGRRVLARRVLGRPLPRAPERVVHRAAHRFGHVAAHLARALGRAAHRVADVVRRSFDVPFGLLQGRLRLLAASLAAAREEGERRDEDGGAHRGSIRRAPWVGERRTLRWTRLPFAASLAAIAMHPLVHHLATMAYGNAWANHRLLAACAELSPEEFVAPRVGFFPSIKATLNHIVTVDWYYVDALEHAMRGEPIGDDARRFFDPEEPFDTHGPLSDAQHAVDRRLVNLCVALREEDLQRPVAILRATGVQHEPTTRLLAHLFQHQIHHRGQVHCMLSGTSVPPPQLDEFFCANEAHLRARELAELGYGEAQIWS
jgi:uncharacterized damage-inducible protein DinB